MKVIQVNANQYETKTGIIVTRKQPIIFNVVGTWKDAYIECTADGWTGKDAFPLFPALYDNPLTDSQKQVPGYPFLMLMGSVSGIPFEIGDAKTKTLFMPTGGELILFPNDINWLYWNNSGSLSVFVSVGV